ncbi:MAG: aldo/keto reductase [Phycisphaerales bacterium]|nr:aldo/keto reductase [Phycisphaerales bacterium]
MDRTLGRTGLRISPIAFGAFKIGRNLKTKYAESYDLPDDHATEVLLNGVLDAGVNLIDTAPAYGSSEVRIGTHLSHRRDEYTLCTKVGETFEGNASTHRFDEASVDLSITQSLRNLRTDRIDLVQVHSDGSDMDILNSGDPLRALQKRRDQGDIRFMGFSGKTPEGNLRAVQGGQFDVVMVEYHPLDTSQFQVIEAAAIAGVGVLVKKGLASGRLAPTEAIPFCLTPPGVGSMVVGTLDLGHLKDNLLIAQNATSTQ